MILLAQFESPIVTLEADETVPAQNIEQFVDVFKRIK